MEELKFLEEQQVASELIKRVEEFRSQYEVVPETAGRIVKPSIPFYGKDQHCPYLRPQKINTFIGIGSRQREFLDDLLPGDGVDSAVGYHQEQEQVKQRTAEIMFIILNRCSFGKNTCQ